MSTSNEPPISRPSDDRFDAIVARLGFDFDEADRTDYRTLVDGVLSQIDRVAEAAAAPVPLDTPSGDRPPGYRPDADEDPHNAWIVKCRVVGADDGPLSGTRVGLKDTIALAGYAVTAGSSLLAGFTPDVDATVVTRLLGAGATVVGKQNMEAFAHSGSGDFSDFGPVTNPHDPDRLAGGSSSGSAAALAAGDCDVSIGGDQIGSIRIPSAWCGVVGLKPTYGLVPYTGVVPSELSYDHLGPMARSVETVARTLDVIAGVDERDGVRLDHRQPRAYDPPVYEDAAVDAPDPGEMTIGVLEEGFEWEAANPGVDAAVREAIAGLEAAGATTTAVSVELHRLTVPICIGVLTQGQHRLRREGSVGTNRKGWFWGGLGEAVRAAIADRPDGLPLPATAASIAAAHLNETAGVRPYARAKNLVLEAARGYNRCLEGCDAIVMPTAPILPYRRDDDLDRVERRAGRPPNFVNTGLTGMTGHPALSVPVGRVDGLPVGAMLVGRPFDDATVLAVGRTLERLVD